jgi:carbon-monoxide dehydrogenase medium subunit
VLGPAGLRIVPAGEFLTGLWSTAVADDELLTAVRFPVWSGRCGFGVREFARRHGDFAIAGAAVAVELGEDDRVRRSGIGLLGLGSTAERATAAEAAATGASVVDLDPAELGRLAVSELGAIPSDLHGSADFRRRVGAGTAAAAWQAAVEEARRG